MLSPLSVIVLVAFCTSAFGFIPSMPQRSLLCNKYDEKLVNTRITRQNMPALNMSVKSQNEGANGVDKIALLVKVFMTSAIIFCVSSLNTPSPALASTAPAAQAIAAAEAKGKTIEELVPEEAPKVTKTSSPRAVSVGKRLKALNAKMYGAFWCSHCNNQKQELGIEVSKLFEYVECDKDGANSQYKICRASKLQGYPTWEIKGELYPGEKDLGELETLLSTIENTK